MKIIIPFILIVFLLTACGSKKEVVVTTTPAVVTETRIEVPSKDAVTSPEVLERDGLRNDVHTPQSEVEEQVAVQVVARGELESTSEAEQNTQAPVAIAAVDHSAFDTLLNRHVSSDGKVNYVGFKSNWNTLRGYISGLSKNLPTETWSKNERLAYWMNAYNAMTIDLILRHQPLESIKDIKDSWGQRFWKLGEKYYNLEEIEHQILRKMGEPRIHFGIVCASYSCPPLLNEAFTAAKVDAQLDAVAHQFVNDPQRNSITRDRVEISKIFTWFKKDFTTNGSLIAYLNQYADTKILADARVRFMEYNWALND